MNYSYSLPTTLTLDRDILTDSAGKVDRRIAQCALVVLFPLIVVRCLSAWLCTKRILDRYEIMHADRSIQLFRFAGFHRGRQLGLLINVARGDIRLVGREIRVSENQKAQVDRNNVRGAESPLGMFSYAALRRKSGTNYDSNFEDQSVDGQYSKNIAFLLRYAVAHVLSAGCGLDQPEQVSILGVSIDNTTVAKTLECVTESLHSRHKRQFAFVNPDCLNKAVADSSYVGSLQSMSCVLADGFGLQIASRLLGINLKENINGTDLFPLICRLAEKKGKSIYLLGGRPGVAQKTANWCKYHYPDLSIAGTHHGYFSNGESTQIIQQVNQSQADILLVAFGAPLQELWLEEFKTRLDPVVQMGVGGLFDFYSGRISRSPRWMQEIGLEWLYRLMQEPQRMWKRYVLGNPAFLARVIMQKIRGKDKSVQRRYHHTGWLSRVSKFGLVLNTLLWRSFAGTTPVLKRVCDVIGALSVLVCLSPILIITSFLIRIESPGSVFFSQVRVGKYGRCFKMHKFRSMYVDAEEQKKSLMMSNEMPGGIIFKMRSDPRITRVGRFIRKYSIDELPQLLNVLVGDMSLVGPRPPLPAEVASYNLIDRRRLEIAPGITCLWQVSGRSEIPFDEQVDLDIEYIESRSLVRDVNILCKTIPAVLLGKGAY